MIFDTRPGLHPGADIHPVWADAPNGCGDVFDAQSSRENQTVRRQPFEPVPGKGSTRAAVAGTPRIQEVKIRREIVQRGKRTPIFDAKSFNDFESPIPAIIRTLIAMELKAPKSL